MAANVKMQITYGSFRPDLFYRLSVFPILMPSLRARREDVPLLVWYFITIKQGPLGKRIEKVQKETMEALKAYDWSGNVRELENVIEECGWKIKGKANAADRLGLHPSTLHNRMKKLGIVRPKG
jgi:formate hydrogenlyase transcriptional activator